MLQMNQFSVDDIPDKSKLWKFYPASGLEKSKPWKFSQASLPDKLKG